MLTSRSLLAAACFALTAASLHAQNSTVWTIGGEGAIGTELGRTPKVLVLPEHIAVLEMDAPFLKLFSHDGRFIQATGAKGMGPGEFLQPTAMAYDSAARELMIVDGRNLRVTSYPLADSLLSPRMLVLSEASTQDICILNSRIFSIASNSPTMVRELVVEGRRLDLVRAFANVRSLHPLGEHPQVANQSAGLLHCDESAHRLIVLSQTLGEVHIIVPDSNVHRTRAMRNFRTPKISVDAGMVFFDYPADAARDAVLDVIEVDGNVAAVVRRSTRDRSDHSQNGYRLVQVDFLDSVPRIQLSRWRYVGRIEKQALCVQDEPIPQIALFNGPHCQ